MAFLDRLFGKRPPPVAPTPAAAVKAAPAPEPPPPAPEPMATPAAEPVAAAAPEPAAPPPPEPVAELPPAAPLPTTFETLVAANVLPAPPPAAEPAPTAEPEPTPAAATAEAEAAPEADIEPELESEPDLALPPPLLPNSRLDFALVVKRDGTTELDMPLSSEWLADLVGAAPDRAESEALFDLISEHPSAQVRQALAYKDHLGEAAIGRLANAPEYSVLERLLRSAQFRVQVMPEQLFELMDRHPELARSVAEDYEGFLNCHASQLLRQLAQHPDPSVRRALVENRHTGAAALRSFLADPDADVSLAARRRLLEA